MRRRHSRPARAAPTIGFEPYLRLLWCDGEVGGFVANVSSQRSADDNGRCAPRQRSCFKKTGKVQSLKCDVHQAEAWSLRKQRRYLMIVEIIHQSIP